MSTTTYRVREDGDRGFNVGTQDGWGIGHTFANRGFAEAAAAKLNELVDGDAATGTQPRLIPGTLDETLAIQRAAEAQPVDPDPLPAEFNDVEPAAMAITFAGEAYESFQAWVELGVADLGKGRAGARYFVQVTETDTGKAFDAWLIGIDRRAEMGNTIKVVRNDDSGSTDPDLSKVESVEADRLHIY